MKTRIILQNLMLVLFLLLQLPRSSSTIQQSATIEASFFHPISTNIEGYH
jgi:hypothetical protein